ncbi:MAG: GAF domain-containing protein [Lachnospiraceae bacterium]|nr:GAF domain-containing protein [Lachnospiraceae bacterium]
MKDDSAIHSGFDLNRMISIAIDISAERDFDRLMQKILLEAMNVCHCDAGTVYMKEKEHLIFSTMFTKSKGLTIEEQNSQTMPPPVPLTRTHVCACAVIDNKKINIPDVYESTDYDFAGAQKYDAMTGYRTGSMLVIPMCDEKGEIIGVLQLINSLDEKGEIIPFDPAYEQIVSALASLAAVSLNNHKLAQEIFDLLHSFVRVMVDAIDARSSYNANHTRSMVKYAERFIAWLDETGQDFRIPDKEKDAFLMSIWLHDIGKLVIPLEIMDKPDRLGKLHDGLKSRVEVACLMERIRGYEHPEMADECQARADALRAAWDDIEDANTIGFLNDERLETLKSYADITCLNADGEEIPLLNDDELEAITVRKGTLTDDERHQIEEHVEYTARMLGQMNFKGVYEQVPFWAGSHHELLNGLGYPNKLTAPDIPNEVRLLTILDVYDALTAEDRPYKPPMPSEKAFSILESMRDEGRIDGDILKLFKDSGAWNNEVSE